jgi:hypothetical protein
MRNGLVIKPIGLLLMVMMLSTLAFAGEEKAGNGDAAAEERRSKLILFVGYAQSDDEGGGSVGFEYEYKINSLLGVGGMVEYAGGELDSWLIGVPIFIHPLERLYFLMAPAAEIEDGDNNFVFRIGAGYDFEIYPDWAIAPELNLDLNRKDEDLTVTFGIALSYEF